METKFIINRFNELSIEEQKEIQDYISRITTLWRIEENEN